MAWRMLDPGPRTAAWQMACDAAMLEIKSAGASPDTLRFQAFERPAVLVGFHQAVEERVDEEHCRAKGIDVNRRVSGGGAMYVDAGQLGWEVVVSRAAYRVADVEPFVEKVAAAVCDALSHFGARAAKRGRDDLEVDGRKISGVAAASEGDALLVHGTVLVDSNADEMSRALRPPSEKHATRRLLSVTERVTDLKRLFGSAPRLEDVRRAVAESVGRAFGVRLEAGGLLPLEEDALKRQLAEKSSDAWVRAMARPPGQVDIRAGTVTARGGSVRALAGVREHGKLAWVLFTGDYFAHPFRAIRDLEAALQDVESSAAEDVVLRFFQTSSCDTPGVEPFHFAAALRAALGSP